MSSWIRVYPVATGDGTGAASYDRQALQWEQEHDREGIGVVETLSPLARVDRRPVMAFYEQELDRLRTRGNSEDRAMMLAGSKPRACNSATQY